MQHPLWQVDGLFIWILTPGQRKTSSNLLKAVQGPSQTLWGANTLQPLWEVGELLRCPVGWVYPQLVEYHIISFPLSHSFNDRKSVLIILLLGSVDALHYTVTATVDFVLGMYFNLTSYLCHSPVTPQAELVYWAAITDPWKLVCFRYFEIQCIAKKIAQQLQKLAQKGRET